MEPLLHEGQVVFVDRHAYRRADPTEGDIVVAHHPWRSELLIVHVGNQGGVALERLHVGIGRTHRAVGQLARVRVEAIEMPII